MMNACRVSDNSGLIPRPWTRTGDSTPSALRGVFCSEAYAMPQRFLKPGFRTSQRMAKCSRDARLTYINLITLVDDWGRYEGDLILLKSECFPYDDILKEDFNGWIDELVQSGVLYRYDIDGLWYVQMCRWTERARSKVSRYPACEPLTTNAAPSDNKCCARRSTKGSGPYGDDDGAYEDGGDGADDGKSDAQLIEDALLSPHESGGGMVEESELDKLLAQIGVPGVHRRGPKLRDTIETFVSRNGGPLKTTELLRAAIAAGCDSLDRVQTFEWTRTKQDANNGKSNGKATHRLNPSLSDAAKYNRAISGFPGGEQGNSG